MKKVAIVQSNYIPWKGYFDMIAAVDEFVFYDDMQLTRRDWRNRNLIKTPQGLQWLTVPVKVKGKYHQSIRETDIQGSEWVETHLRSLTVNYARAPHFTEIFALIEPAYRGGHTKLSALNRDLVQRICKFLGITTKLTNSWDYTLVSGKTERLADICRQAGGDRYISGAAAKDYVDEAVFAKTGIGLEWFEYDGYPVYPQLWGEFVHGVSVLDLLFNCGVEAPRFMKHVKKGAETTEHGGP